MTGTFGPEESLSRDLEGGREAVERLQQRDRSPTARVFAAGSTLRDSPLSVEAALVSYARDVNDLDVTVAPRVREELRKLCRAAREQNYAVDLSRVLERTTPSTKPEALVVARRRVDTPPEQRARRLAVFVRDARLNGIDLSMDDLEGTPGLDGVNQRHDDRSRHALVQRGRPKYVEPPVAETTAASAESDTVAAEGVYSTSGDGDDTDPIAVDGGAEPASESIGGTGGADTETETDATARESRPDGSGSDHEMLVSKTQVTDLRADEWQPRINTVDVAATTDDPTNDDEDETRDRTETKSNVQTGESTFVWPAADEDIDPDVSPTVNVGERGGEAERSEGSAGLVTDGTVDESERTPEKILEGIDLSGSPETPAVRIVEDNRTDGSPPDLRTLTASLSATGTTVTDALDR